MDSEIPSDSPDIAPAEGDTLIERVEEVVEQVEAAVVNAVHTIEHRCFGRPTADHPVVVITHTGN